MLRLSFLLLALAACALAASVPRDAAAAKEEASSTAAAAAAPKAAAPKAPAAKSVQSASKAAPQALYTSKFDNVNLDQILKSERLLNNYFKCLMEKGPCTPDAAELKRLLPDALETDCSKCTPKQREGSEKVIEHMIKNKPSQWTELQAKYDPNGNYKSKYQHLADEKGLKV